MKFLVFVFFSVLFISCNQDKFKKIDAESIAEKELLSINFDEVDRFPLFKACDETASKVQQKECFQKNLHKWLKPHIDSLVYETEKADTIQLFVSVNANGKLNCDSLNSKLAIKDQMKTIFTNSPEIYPAQKRGIPVKVSFQLPLILKVN